MELKIYDTNLNLIGIIDTSTAVIWNRKYYSAGSFEIHAPANSIEISLIQKQYLVTKTDSLEFGIIEDVMIEQREDGEFIKATGRFGSSLLGRRIVFDTTVLFGTYEVAMRTLVYDNAINTSIGDRILPNLILGTLNGFTESVNFQVSYRNLLTVIQGLSITSGIATRIRFDSVAKKFVFETYKALNRTVDQSVNPRAIFSNDYDNLLASTYQTSDVEYSNIALVGGEGEGADRKMVVVGSGVGLNRYEVFVNAKDVRMESGITEPNYYAMLAQKGAESLTPRVEYFEGNVLTEGTLNYKQDYDLGDIVTIENNKWGKRINVQITEITEVYDDNGIQVIPVFGTTSPSLGDVISKSTDTSGSGDVDTASLVAATTWADTDLIRIESGATSKKLTIAYLKSLLSSFFKIIVGTNGIGINKTPTGAYDLEVSTGGIKSDGPIIGPNGNYVGASYVGSVDLNTITTVGVYRIDIPTNGPTWGENYGNLLVVKGSPDTLSQIYYNRGSCNSFVRGATRVSMVWGFTSWYQQALTVDLNLGNMNLGLIRTYPILVLNTVVEQSSNVYGFAYSSFGTLTAGVAYLVELEGAITADATSAGYLLNVIMYNASWSWSASIAIYDAVSKKWFLEITPTATEVINIGWWYYPNGGARPGYAYAKFWRLWKKY